MELATGEKAHIRKKLLSHLREPGMGGKMVTLKYGSTKICSSPVEDIGCKHFGTNCKTWVTPYLGFYKLKDQCRSGETG